MILRVPFATFVYAGVLCLSGCGAPEPGPERVPVFGTVERAGAPLSNASISFLPQEGHSGPAASTGIDGGQYRFTAANGPVAGPHRVVIRLSPPAKGLGKTDQQRQTEAPSDADGPTNWQFQIDVPAEGPFEKDFRLDENLP